MLYHTNITVLIFVLLVKKILLLKILAKYYLVNEFDLHLTTLVFFVYLECFSTHTFPQLFLTIGFQISFKEDQTCAFLCEKEYKTGDAEHKRMLKLLERGMKLNYQHHWIVDNMPVSFCFTNQQQFNVCLPSFPMGCYVTPDGRPKDACVLDPRYSNPDSYYLFNHVDILIEYRDLSHDSNMFDHKVGGRVIRIKVLPRSIKHSDKDSRTCGDSAVPQPISATDENLKILYTYSVIWRVGVSQYESILK